MPRRVVRIFALATLSLSLGCPRTKQKPPPAADASVPARASTGGSPAPSASSSLGPSEADSNAAEDAGPAVPLPADVEGQATTALKTLPTELASFVKTSLDARAMSRILGASLARAEGDAGTLDMNRELTRFTSDYRLFGDDFGTVASRSSTPIPESMTLTTSPILWRPDDTSTFLVATGRAKNASAILAFRVENERAELVSAFVMRHDVAPVVLAYDRRARKELYWSTCWKCPGEQGAISPREPGRVAIVQY